MSRWYSDAGSPDLSEYRHLDLRSFHTAVIRSYRAMRSAQACISVILNPRYFGVIEDPKLQVWCCRTSDNTAPRVTCQDREIILRPVREWLFGVEPKQHKGIWLSRALIYSFMAGLDDKPIPLASYLCRRSVGEPCTGKKANEAHQLLREGKKKERKQYYAEYEASHEDGAP